MGDCAYRIRCALSGRCDGNAPAKNYPRAKRPREGRTPFFFSSRRRHTRCSRDWSSDGCSSDLPDIATFVVNALAPAEVAKVVIDEDRERIEVVVPDTNNQLSLAIGRRGQNVRLASQLTGWDIDILTEQEESERRQADFENSTRVFMEALNVDEVVGQLLASEGFTSVEELSP